MKMNDKMETRIKCPQCGFMNAGGTKVCYKCHARIVPESITCPRCAKKNDFGTTKCVSCGFDFTKKRRSLGVHLLINLLFSIALMLVLYFCIQRGEDELVDNFGIAFRVVAVLIIVGVLYATIVHGRKEALKYDAEEEMNDKNPRLQKLKLISSIAVVIGVTAIAIVAIVLFLNR